MRTHILIAAALALSATTVHAAPRSLSAPQSSPVQTAPEAARPADAPVFKVQSNEEAKPSEQSQAAPQPTIAPPAQAAPAAPPADTGVARSGETTPAETQAAPAARPVRQAQRKQRQRQLTVEQHVHRELRSIERSIGSAMGAASAISSLGYAIPLVIYW